jgi:hypothetical protein
VWVAYDRRLGVEGFSMPELLALERQIVDGAVERTLAPLSDPRGRLQRDPLGWFLQRVHSGCGGGFFPGSRPAWVVNTWNKSHNHRRSPIMTKRCNREPAGPSQPLIASLVWLSKSSTTPS